MKISELKRIITEELGEEISWAFTCSKTYELNFDRDRRMHEQILNELSINPYIIQNVIEPDEDMQMIVLRQNLDYIKLIKNPTEKVIRYYIRNKIPKEDTDTNLNAYISKFIKFIKKQNITEGEKRAHVLNNINKELEKLLINKNIENDLEGNK